MEIFILRIWSSAHDHAALVLLFNLVGFFISTRPCWSGEIFSFHNCTSFEGASRGGQPLNIFTWFIGAGGLRSRFGTWLGTTLSRRSANIFVSKLRFAIVWLGQIQNLDIGHVGVLGLVSGFFIYFFGFESTQLARRVQPKRTQMEVQ